MRCFLQYFTDIQHTTPSDRCSTSITYLSLSITLPPISQPHKDHEKEMPKIILSIWAIDAQAVGIHCPGHGTRAKPATNKAQTVTFPVTKQIYKNVLSGCNNHQKLALLRHKNRVKQEELPMNIFTPEEIKPSEKTLAIIRQLAYTYRVIKINGRKQSFCLN